jgi:hypothetical protein
MRKDSDELLQTIIDDLPNENINCNTSDVYITVVTVTAVRTQYTATRNLHPDYSNTIDEKCILRGGEKGRERT